MSNFSYTSEIETKQIISHLTRATFKYAYINWISFAGLWKLQQNLLNVMLFFYNRVQVTYEKNKTGILIIIRQVNILQITIFRVSHWRIIFHVISEIGVLEGIENGYKRNIHIWIYTLKLHWKYFKTSVCVWHHASGILFALHFTRVRSLENFVIESYRRNNRFSIPKRIFSYTFIYFHELRCS